MATRVCSVLLLNFCVSLSMPRATDIRRANPWKRAEYKQHYPDLLNIMEPSFIRRKCFGLSILDGSQRDRLSLLSVTVEHNEKLLELLEKGSSRTFAKFRDALRSYSLPDVFSLILEDLDAIGPEPTSRGEVTDTYFNFRKIL